MSDIRLAIDGGIPAFGDACPSWPLPDERVRAALHAAYADGSWGRYHGPHVQALTDRLRELHRLEYAYPCCSGTVAVELALRGLRVGPDNEVILAAYDFPGNFRCVEAVGARPVLVDIHPGTWCLDPGCLAAAIGPATRAVLVSHLHGGLADMQQICRIAADHGLPVIEDACQAVGARVQGRMAGAWGDAAVLSFGGSKLLTAGRGGAVLTSRADVLQRIRVYCERGNQAFPLSELQATVLLPQLDQLSARNATRRASVRRLLEALAGVPRVTPVTYTAASDEPSYYKLAWLYDSRGAAPCERVVAALRAEGVPVDAGFPGFVRRGVRRCRRVEPLAHSTRAASDTLLLHHPVLLSDDETIQRLAAAMAKVLQAIAA